MRILYITPFEPSLHNGGGRACYANLMCLSQLNETTIDYIGPPLDYCLPGLVKESFRHVIARKFTLIDKIRAGINGASSANWALFYEFMGINRDNSYDIMFVESTRCGFAFPKNIRINHKLCTVHNVELDYMRYNRGFLSNIILRNIKHSEFKSLISCDTALLMHNKDLKRLTDIYGAATKKLRYFFHPVCSFTPTQIPLPLKDRVWDLIFIGSLDAKFNQEGITEFIKKCWPKLAMFDFRLCIAGRNPSQNLINLLSRQRNVELLVNQPSLEPLLAKSKILILPDMSGTGMKLRVAEALSVGVPIVGTEMGLRGYLDDVESFGAFVGAVEEMTEPIIKLLNDEKLLLLLTQQAQHVWRNKYSFEVFSRRLSSIIKEIAQYS